MEKITVPLEPEKLIEIFKDKEKVYEILVEDSVSKGMQYKQILMYLSNLKIKGHLTQISSEFLKCLMTENFLIEAENVSKIVANIYTWHKFGEVLYKESVAEFSEEELAKFCTDNEEFLNQHRTILEAVPAMLFLSSNFTTEEEIDCIKSKLEKDDTAIGSNICSVLALNDFLMKYITPENLGQMLGKKWYTKLFDDYHFNGKKLIQYIDRTDFALYLLAIMKYTGEYSEFAEA